MGANARARQQARVRRRRIKVAVAGIASAAVIAAVVLLAINTNSDGGSSSDGGTVDSTQASVGKPFPQFTLTGMDGQPITNASLAGKTSIVWFTDQWTCSSCGPAAEQFAQLDDELGGTTFQVLAVFVATGQKAADLTAWRKQYGRADWMVAPDDGNRLASTVKLPCLDTKFLLDEGGKILDIDSQVTDARYMGLLRNEVKR